MVGHGLRIRPGNECEHSNQGGEQRLHVVLRHYSVPVGKPALCPACHSSVPEAATPEPPLTEAVLPLAVLEEPPLTMEISTLADMGHGTGLACDPQVNTTCARRIKSGALFRCSQCVRPLPVKRHVHWRPPMLAVDGARRVGRRVGDGVRCDPMQAVLGGCASFGATFYFLDRILD